MPSNLISKEIRGHEIHVLQIRKHVVQVAIHFKLTKPNKYPIGGFSWMAVYVKSNIANIVASGV